MRTLVAGLALLMSLSLARPAGAQVTLKIATLAPEGSSWMNLFHEWQKKVEARTDGRVRVKFYAGGVLGDERDMLRKIRLGQINAAAISGIGLSSIAPEVRALELARTYDELDALRAKLGPDIAKAFEKKGFVFGGWGDVGPVHLFSEKPVRTLDDLRRQKLWLWSDDPVSRKLFAALDVHGVPMGVPEVLPALSTGIVDAFFGTPLATVALQWQSRVRYVSSRTMSEATGATVIAKSVWDKIAPADQAILVEEGNAMTAKVLKQVREDNTRALESMRRSGVQVIDFSPELDKALDAAEEQVARDNAASVSSEFRAEVERLVEEYRKTHAR